MRPAIVLLRRVDPALYAIWAAATTLCSARLFYGYMLKQTGGEWSAPLDDVFIHFDYARSTALGHPFEWTIGNGYSSGNTSITYPFVLAFGWLVGFTGRSLMVWAAIVAAVSVFGVLLAARRLFVEGPRDDWGRLSSYLLPPIFLGVGALDWSLWSGMEVSFFLATWAIALVAFLRLDAFARVPMQAKKIRRAAWLLGLAGALLVTTRPEAAATIAIFGGAAAWAHARASRWRGFGVLFGAGAPSVVALAIQSAANKALTGEWSANGAIVKLALNNPYMTAADKWDDWLGNVRYAVTRNLDYHFAHIEGENMSAALDHEPFAHALDAIGLRGAYEYLARTAWWAGVVPLALATLPLLFPRTRRLAAIVWAQIVAWFVIVSLNGQVRWQNERYVMPGVAWMLILAALGVSVVFRRAWTKPNVATTLVVGALVVQTIGVLTRPPGPPHFRLSWALAFAGGALAWALMRSRRARIALVAVAVLFAYDHQILKMRDQKWFFGRAARNIRDQHLTLGAFLGQETEKPHRVLVGDAGAILYESDLPGLDIIGLGGYHGLPFARAGVHGLPATIELLERIPASDRPDVLAIFPTWWGVLPIWFASDVIRRFPVEGNVICGGYEQNVYQADWSLLGTGERIREIPRGDLRVKQTVDVADLLSEQANGYVFDHPANGWTEMRILPDPADPVHGLLDGGRRIAVGRGEHFVLSGVEGGVRPAHIVVRTAPENRTRVSVRVQGAEVGALDLDRGSGWLEAVVRIPPERVLAGATVELVNEGPGDFVDFHVWVTQ
ncbi:MAG TPA: hypothetical protein VIF62_22005 [Labilithrix sp.]